jgi:hypothetical protein
MDQPYERGVTVQPPSGAHNGQDDAVRAITAACCFMVPAFAPACGDDARWEVVVTLRADVTDPHEGDACAELAGDTTKSFTASTDGDEPVSWTVEARNRTAAERVAACFDPLADTVEVRER